MKRDEREAIDKMREVLYECKSYLEGASLTKKNTSWMNNEEANLIRKINEVLNQKKARGEE